MPSPSHRGSSGRASFAGRLRLFLSELSLRGLTQAAPLVLCAAFATLCAIDTATAREKLALVVALGMSPEEVVRRSTLPIRFSLHSVGGAQAGGTLVTAPHRFVYQDATLNLVLPEAGNKISMPTGILVMNGRVSLVSASALGDYVNLAKAIGTSRTLLEAVVAQGFEYGRHDPAQFRYPRFLLARKNSGAPRTVENFEEMEQAFLNSPYYLQEFLVFSMVKQDLQISLRVSNMRRLHTEGRVSTSTPSKTLEERAAYERDKMNERFLRSERAYYLDVSVIPRSP